MKVFEVLVLLLFFPSILFVSGYRILAILPLAARSHHNFHQGVLKALAKRGHEVVVYGPFPQPTPLPNYKDVYVNTSYSEDLLTYEGLIHILNTPPTMAVQSVWKGMTQFTEATLKHDNIQKLIQSGEKFDLVIVEAFMAQEALLAFGHIFNAPTIVFQPFGTFSLPNKVMGNSLAIPHIPDYSFPYSNKMSLYERALNSYGIVRSLLEYYNKALPVQQSLVDRYLNLKGAPPLVDMVHNISMVFTNGHQTVNYPQPLPPNIIPLGGIHLSTERKPLPSAIQNFMDNANHGVIYFSFGSCIPDHRMPPEFYHMFLTVFRNLKQNVLWKTRRENITGVPPNVMIAKWVSQQDVLAHPNTVLFITHGGLLSLLEVTHAGVPVIGVPFFADQPMNVRFYEWQGVGIKLDFTTLTEETISNAIVKVLSNPKYKENAVKLSKLSQSLPMSQQEAAVFWTEHVLQHGGAHHLRPESANMSWYQLMLLDVLAVILAVILVAVMTLFILFKMTITWLTGAKNKNFNGKKLN